MRTIKLILLSLMFVDCSKQQTLIDNLVLRDNKYYEPAHLEIPFSGTAVSKFKNGQTSNIAKFEKGIPFGEWVSYGFNGEIIQKGTYEPMQITITNIDNIKKIKRISISSFTEGDQKLTYLYLISNTKTDVPRKSSIFNTIIDNINRNGGKVSSNLIDSVIVAKGEF